MDICDAKNLCRDLRSLCDGCDGSASCLTSAGDSMGDAPASDLERARADAQRYCMEQAYWRLRAETAERERDAARQEIAALSAERDAAKADAARFCTAWQMGRRTDDELEPVNMGSDVHVTARPQCSGRRPMQVCPSSFVMRRCQLADGHDGKCEPA